MKGISQERRAQLKAAGYSVHLRVTSEQKFAGYAVYHKGVKVGERATAPLAWVLAGQHAGDKEGAHE